MAKRKLTIADLQKEAKETGIYPKLNENPNAIYDPKSEKVIQWDSDNCIVFTYLNDKKIEMVIGIDTHNSLFFEDTNKFRIYPEYFQGRGPCSGRLFKTQKIISFWSFPESHEELIEALEKIEKATWEKLEVHLNLLTDKNWKVEFPTDKKAIRDL